MKTFLKILGVLFILLFQFSSCLDLDREKPIYYYYDEPVVVGQMGEYPMVYNQSYLFHVPELIGNTKLKAGDLLWSSFIVDLGSYVATNSIIYPHRYTAESFRYETVDSAKVIIPSDAEEFESFLSDDFSTSIELAVIYKYAIDSLWFLGLKQQGQSKQLSYTYELILNPKIENSNNYPTLYIRSKQINAPTENALSEDRNIFAFDVADFVNYYRKEISSTDDVRFNLKYKIGVNSNGGDIYREFISNPISWNFSLGRPY